MFTDQTLYRAQALEPIAGYDDVVMLIDVGEGPATKYGTSFFGVNAIRPIAGLGPHGLFLIWTQANAAPAGYGPLPGGIASGTIPLGGSVTCNQPPGLNLGSYGLAQVRWTMEIPTALTGVADDIDIGVLMQGGQGDFGVPAIQPGRFNMVDQFQSPGDAIADPAQGANKALPAAFPSDNPWDNANLSELYWFESNPPSFQIFNNGAAAQAAGAIGLRFKGFRFLLSPLTPDVIPFKPRFLAGKPRMAPDVPGRIVVVPLVPPSGTTLF